MKIALICTEKLPVPAIAGGAVQLYIDGILPALSKVHDLTVFCVQYPGLPDEEEVDGVRYVRVPGQSRVEYITHIQLKMTEQYDLIHVFNRPNYVMKLSEHLPETKFSLSLHNEMFLPEKIAIHSAVNCINKVEFITTVSRFIADGVRKLYPIADKKLFPVYSGVDTEIFAPVFSEDGQRNKAMLKQKLGLEDKKVILFVGRLSVKKGVDKLLNAMKKVMDSRGDTALVVVGSKWYGHNKPDDYTRSVETLSKSLDGRVVFTGFLPPSQIPMYFSLGDVFICPSQWNEPLARVHYEAMAAGLPIITTNRGGNAEVVQGWGNGIIIDDYANADVFAEQILKLLNDPSAGLEMGRRGRALAEERYTWKRVADDLMKLFQKVEDNVPVKETEEGSDETLDAIPAVALDTTGDAAPIADSFDDLVIKPDIPLVTEKSKKVQTRGIAEDPFLSSEEVYYLKLFGRYLD